MFNNSISNWYIECIYNDCFMIVLCLKLVLVINI